MNGPAPVSTALNGAASTSHTEGKEIVMNPVPEERSISQLIGDSLAELSKLVQNEIDLARAELQQKLSLFGGAARLIAAGATLLIPGLVLVLFAIAAELIQLGVPAPLAYLCSGLGASILSLALVWVGATRLSGATLKPSATLNEIRRDKSFAKELMR
jgi:Putative Actinobacterial Holin-X, holin superfamily III